MRTPRPSTLSVAGSRPHKSCEATACLDRWIHAFFPYGQKTYPALRYLKNQVFQWGRIYRRDRVCKGFVPGFFKDNRLYFPFKEEQNFV